MIVVFWFLMAAVAAVVAVQSWKGWESVSWSFAEEVAW